MDLDYFIEGFRDIRTKSLSYAVDSMEPGHCVWTELLVWLYTGGKAFLHVSVLPALYVKGQATR